MRKLRTAADAGNAGAQFNLGVMLHDRPDAKDQPAGQNRAEAIGWLLKAALQGLPRAQLKLAEVYANPPASRDEQVRACTWFLVAATSATGIHLHRAQTGYARLVERLSPDQVTMATQDADSTIEELRRRAAAAASE